VSVPRSQLSEACVSVPRSQLSEACVSVPRSQLSEACVSVPRSQLSEACVSVPRSQYDLEENPVQNKIFWLIPLQLLWANLHIYFFIGIAMTAGFLLEKIIIHRNHLKKNPLIKKLSFLILSLMAISLINPYGIKLLLYPLNIFKNYGYDIVENKSPLFLQHLMHDSAIPAFKIAVVLLIISFFFSFRQWPIFLFLASLSTIIAGFLMIRNFPLFALIFLPAISINLKNAAEKVKIEVEIINERVSSALKITLPCILTGVIILIFFHYLNGAFFQNKEKGVGLTFQSNASAEFFIKENLRGPIFNNYDIGSYLIYRLYPKEKVFVDNRPEAYPKDFFDHTYLPMQMNEEKWREFDKKYNFNIIYFTQQEGTWWGQSFLRQRLRDDGWALIYADSQAVILIKNSPENQAIIQQYKIAKENIIDKIIYLKNNNLKTQMNGVHLLDLIGRYDLAIDWCQELNKKYPDEGRIWLEMGYLKSAENNAESLKTSSQYLEKAIELGENLPATYNQLGLVYFNLGQFSKAKNAWQQALNSDPDNQNAKDYLKQYEALNLP
jgi:tetratricopeptide (TPR) repeat protein